MAAGRKEAQLPSPGEPLYAAALALWNIRERAFPQHTRRQPDATDVATGAWARIVKEAEACVEAYLSAQKAAGETDEEIKWR